jgi:hypothetical protein
MKNFSTTKNGFLDKSGEILLSTPFCRGKITRLKKHGNVKEGL